MAVQAPVPRAAYAVVLQALHCPAGSQALHKLVCPCKQQREPAQTPLLHWLPVVQGRPSASTLADAKAQLADAATQVKGAWQAEQAPVASHSLQPSGRGPALQQRFPRQRPVVQVSSMREQSSPGFLSRRQEVSKLRWVMT
jgi:hypothetical protein